MSNNFEDRSWPEIQEYINNNALILIPIGAIEEHGPHLPVSTDMIIARSITEAVAEKIKDKIKVLITPNMWQAYNGFIMQNKWPGSLTVSQDTQKKLLYEITVSIIKMGFRKILYINSHGQNLFTMEGVIRQIADEFSIHIPYVFEYNVAKNFMIKNRRSEIGGISHGCELETSLMLYLTDLVDMSKAEKNMMKYNSEFRNADAMQGNSTVFWSTWCLEETSSGVLGDPTVATRELGEKLFNYLVEKISIFALEYYNN